MSEHKVPRILTFDPEKEEDKPVPKRPKILTFESEEPKAELKSSGPKILHFEDPVPVTAAPERRPTTIKIPDVVQEIPAEARKPKVLTFLFQEVIAPKPERKPTQLLGLPDAEVRRRLEVSQGDLEELFPKVKVEIREKARNLVLSSGIGKHFTKTCGMWGTASQGRLVNITSNIDSLNANATLVDVRGQMNSISDFFCNFKDRLEGKTKSGMFSGLRTANAPVKTHRERFDELMTELNQKISKLNGRMYELQNIQQNISDTSSKLSEAYEELQVYIVAGELIEFRALLGEVEVSDIGLIETDREILKSRIESLRVSLSNISALRDQLRLLYVEVATLQNAIQNTLMVEVPQWKASVLVNGFESSGKVASGNSGWLNFDQLIKKLRS